MPDQPSEPGGIRLGLRENLPQFSLLVGVNALVGGMIGQERTVLPLLAEDEFGLTAFTATLTFIAAFGVVKAITNFLAGTLSDRFGRKPVLVAGWIVGVPVPLLLICVAGRFERLCPISYIPRLAAPRPRPRINRSRDPPTADRIAKAQR